jgi:hypothetical protein
LGLGHSFDAESDKSGRLVHLQRDGGHRDERCRRRHRNRNPKLFCATIASAGPGLLDQPRVLHFCWDTIHSDGEHDRAKRPIAIAPRFRGALRALATDYRIGRDGHWSGLEREWTKEKTQNCAASLRTISGLGFPARLRRKEQQWHSPRNVRSHRHSHRVYPRGFYGQPRDVHGAVRVLSMRS